MTTSLSKETSLPKALNCRLSSDDLDIKEDLSNHSDKTARIKEIYRLGLQFEAMKKSTHMIPKEHTAEMYRLWIDELQDKYRKKFEELNGKSVSEPTPSVYQYCSKLYRFD